MSETTRTVTTERGAVIPVVELNGLSEYVESQHRDVIVEFPPGGEIGDREWNFQYMHNTSVILEQNRKLDPPAPLPSTYMTIVCKQIVPAPPASRTPEALGACSIGVVAGMTAALGSSDRIINVDFEIYANDHLLDKTEHYEISHDLLYGGKYPITDAAPDGYSIRSFYIPRYITDMLSAASKPPSAEDLHELRIAVSRSLTAEDNEEMTRLADMQPTPVELRSVISIDIFRPAIASTEHHKINVAGDWFANLTAPYMCDCGAVGVAFSNNAARDTL